MELLQQIMWDCGSLSSGAIEFLVYMYINLFAYFENLHNKYFLMHLNVWNRRRAQRGVDYIRFDSCQANFLNWINTRKRERQNHHSSQLPNDSHHNETRTSQHRYKHSTIKQTRKERTARQVEMIGRVSASVQREYLQVENKEGEKQTRVRSLFLPLPRSGLLSLNLCKFITCKQHPALFSLSLSLSLSLRV